MAKLFLDDFRFPKDVYPEAEENKFDIVRSYDDFVEYIEQNGLPEFISIDNDLGFDVKRRKISLSGFDAANWLVQESGLFIIDFIVAVKVGTCFRIIKQILIKGADKFFDAVFDTEAWREIQTPTNFFEVDAIVTRV